VSGRLYPTRVDWAPHLIRIEEVVEDRGCSGAPDAGRDSNDHSVEQDLSCRR
jgi:hypothetical protein